MLVYISRVILPSMMIYVKIIEKKNVSQGGQNGYRPLNMGYIIFNLKGFSETEKRVLSF